MTTTLAMITKTIATKPTTLVTKPKTIATKPKTIATKPKTLAKLSMLLAIALLTLLSACSDDSTEPQPPSTISFTLGEDALGGSEGGGVLWLSDDQGAVLTATEWSSDTTLTLDLGQDAPATVTYTLAAGNRHELTLVSEYDVPLGTTHEYNWTSSGETMRTATVTVINAPSHVAWVLSYQDGSRSSTATDFDTRQIYFYTDIVDIYVRLDLATGEHRSAWVRGVTDGQTVTLDYATDGLFSDLVAHSVTLPAGTTQYTAFLQTTVDSGSREGVITFDWQDDDADVPDALTFYAPDWAAIADLQLSMFLRDSSEPPLSYQMRTDGVMPDAFMVMPGEFSPTQTAPGVADLAMTGAWDTATLSWRQHLELYCGWSMVVDSPRAQVVLPQLPEVFTERYPDCTRDGFDLGWVELVRHDGEGVRLGVAWSQ